MKLRSDKALPRLSKTSICHQASGMFFQLCLHLSETDQFTKIYQYSLLRNWSKGGLANLFCEHYRTRLDGRHVLIARRRPIVWVQFRRGFRWLVKAERSSADKTSRMNRRTKRTSLARRRAETSGYVGHQPAFVRSQGRFCKPDRLMNYSD